MLAGIAALGQEKAGLEVTLNGGALTEAGWCLASGADRVAAVLQDAGMGVGAVRVLGPCDLRRLPATWGKRLAFGREPQAVQITAALGT